MQLPRSMKRLVSLLADATAILVALIVAHVLAYLYQPPSDLLRWAFLYVALTIGSLAVFTKLGLYRAVVRYVSFRALGSVLVGVFVSTLWLWALRTMLQLDFPGHAVANYGLMALLMIGGSRLIMREIYHRMVSRRKRRVLIYGAGSAGRQLAQALMNGEQFHPVVFVDDDRTLQRTTILGIPVIDPSQVEDAVTSGQIERILLALPSATRSVRKQILESLQPLNIRVQTIPGMADMVNGDISIDSLQDVNIEDLLGRDPVAPDTTLMQKHIRDKVVMVTGAGGSIGSELCRQIILQKPRALVLFELSEYSLYAIDRELRQLCDRHGVSLDIFPMMGSVQNQARVEGIMKAFKVQTVYHAAAYKHVPLVEFNMVEGVRNNVFGTWATAEAAINARVQQFVLISTDKAVRPTNVMGTTKRLAELVLQSLAERENVSTRFCMVRFGNVLGSSGSVVPLFKQQIELGGPVTVTHPDITRYFMTIPEAAQLVIQAGTMGSTGSVFVLDMGEPVRIVDMAKKMINLSGLELRTRDNPDGDIEISFTGLRPGEKLYEELLIGDNVVPCAHPRIMQAQEDFMTWSAMHDLLQLLDNACEHALYDTIRKLLLQAPCGYTPSEDHVNDLLARPLL
ncbi:polysaccharide biosynthesis protein [Pseudidiomarina andamanensis]|uniref:Polysaccharide biosynthesis protein n=1 Tax=Pseudidiomarina andamanensis TaxID=1940690 RepID=A0AA92IMS0_9GAMM|nr:polysaccharide biosynthesis protein [Pseudidiomarina andamanensis]